MKTLQPCDNNRKGDMAEFYAVTWLWDQGYEVFQNSGCSGPVDMIAMKNNEIILIDVKTFYERGDNPKASLAKGIGLITSHKRTKKQKEIGVKLLGFNPETRKLRFIKHQEEQDNATK
tara:strand:+ start:85 stop:438 length:354 start_codon:yes stop_codon:yes gene_type:complete